MNLKSRQNKMPKQVIVIMDDHYPFGQCQQSTSQNTRVLVRKIYQVSMQERNRILEKAAILRKLNCEQLIRVQSVLQEEDSIHFLFEYIPIRLQTWISNINDQFIENFRDQVISFSCYLANNLIKIEFRLKNIGMDHSYGAKYFLDPSFTYDPTLDKQKQKSQYIRDITNLFRPYIGSNQQPEQMAYGGTNSKNNSQSRKEGAVNNKNSAISPPTYNDQPSKDQVSTKKKQKLDKYYQQMNASMDVQNEKILQQFMNVLDDQDEEQLHRPKGQTQVQARSVPPQYQYGYDPRQQNNPKQTPNKYQVNLSGSAMLNSQNLQKEKFKQSNEIMVPPKVYKNYQPTEQPQYRQQVVWRDGDDLQNRIKNAINNSKSIINRFKSIKQSCS